MEGLWCKALNGGLREEFQQGSRGGSSSEKCYSVPSVCSLNSFYGLGVVTVSNFLGLWDFLQCLWLKNIHCCRQVTSWFGLVLCL